jgi:hypothetical protein
MRASILLLMLGAASCATQSAGSGTVTLMSNVDYHAPPATFSVGSGHVTGRGRQLDAYVEQGCVKGEMNGEALNLCEREVAPDGTQRWEGNSGQVEIKPVDGGRNFQVSGYMTLSSVRQLDVTQTLRPQQGAGWDELRAQPVLLLVATTAADLTAIQRRGRTGL